ncbi:hypothetical protein JKP88DRAFT_264401 [Tribonema minus]|uniref:Gelsolin-like domain-containing protein n=1 Tax=Tribonema minus TaxID=303371 RepID=A0A836CCG2_9STRA|nr:hypothetical protein JKP88DRAFT_264401 [Tribonema minus]
MKPPLQLDLEEDVARPETVLLRVYKQHLERVPLVADALNHACCYLLADPKGKRLFTFIGLSSHFKDRNFAGKIANTLIAEVSECTARKPRLHFVVLIVVRKRHKLNARRRHHIGRRVIHSKQSSPQCTYDHFNNKQRINTKPDFLGYTRVPIVRQSMLGGGGGSGAKDEIVSFREALCGTGVDLAAASSAAAGDAPRPAIAAAHRLHVVTPGQPEPALLHEVRPADPSPAAALFQHALLLGRPGAAYLLETQHECFVYCTAAAAEATRAAALRAARSRDGGGSWAFVTVVDEGHETALFRQRFAGWPAEGFSPSRRGKMLRASPRERAAQLAQQHAAAAAAAAAHLQDSPLERRNSMHSRMATAMRSLGAATLPRPKAPPSLSALAGGAHRTTWRPDRPGTGRVVAPAADWLDEAILGSNGGGGGGGSGGGGGAQEPLVPLSGAGIRAEVQRSMLSQDRGTPAALAGGCGDPSDPALTMRHALDGKGHVRQWRVEMPVAAWRALMVPQHAASPPAPTAGGGKAEAPAAAEGAPALAFREMPPARHGVFTSGDAYVVAMTRAYVVLTETADAGARGASPLRSDITAETVVYLWLGQDYPLRDQLRSKVKHEASENLLRPLINAGNVSQQRVRRVIVDQGREPPFLIGLFSQSQGGIIVISGSATARRRHSSRLAASTPTAPPSPLAGGLGTPALLVRRCLMLKKLHRKLIHICFSCGPPDCSASTTPSPRAPPQSPSRPPPPPPSERAPPPPPGSPPPPPLSAAAVFDETASPLQSGRGRLELTGNVRNAAGATRVFEVAEVPSYPFLAAAAVVCTEIGAAALAAHGLQPRKSYVVIGGARGATGSYSALWVWHAAGAGERAEALLAHVVRNARVLFLPGVRKQSPPGLMRGYVYHLKPGCAIPDEFWNVLGTDPASAPPECSALPLMRAVRLWQADYTLALKLSMNVRAGDPHDAAHWVPYLREVGPLCAFTQADLLPTHSYLLDAGTDSLFVWHGSAAPLKARQLALRCGKAYAAGTCVGVEASPALVPTVVQVESGKEPADFLACFRGWSTTRAQHASAAAAADAPSPIDPYDLADEDVDDVRAADNALAEAAEAALRPVRTPAGGGGGAASGGGGRAPSKGGVHATGTRTPRSRSRAGASGAARTPRTGAASKAGGGGGGGSGNGDNHTPGGDGAGGSGSSGGGSGGGGEARTPRRRSGDKGGGDGGGGGAGSVERAPRTNDNAQSCSPSRRRSSAKAAASAERSTRSASASNRGSTASTDSAATAAAAVAAAAAAHAALLASSDDEAASAQSVRSTVAPPAPFDPDAEHRYAVEVVPAEGGGGGGGRFLMRVRDVGEARSSSGAAAAAASAAAAAALGRPSWTLSLCGDDFLALAFLIEGDAAGTANAFPTAAELAAPRRAEAARRLTLWLAELLSGERALRLRARYRLHAFLGVPGLAGMRAAAEAEAAKQSKSDGAVVKRHVGMRHMTDANVRSAALSSARKRKLTHTACLFASLRMQLASVGREVAADQAVLKYKLKEAETRLSYARAQEEEERHRAGLYRRDLDSLFKRRRRLREELHAAQMALGGSGDGGAAATSDMRRGRSFKTPASRGGDAAAAAAAAADAKKMLKSASFNVGGGSGGGAQRRSHSPSAHGGRATPTHSGTASKLMGKFKGMLGGGSSAQGGSARSRDTSLTPKSSMTPKSSAGARSGSVSPRTPAVIDAAAAAGGEGGGVVAVAAAAHDAGPEVNFGQHVQEPLRARMAELAGVEEAYAYKLRRRNEHVARADKARLAGEDAEGQMAALSSSAAALLMRGDAFVDAFVERLAASVAARVPSPGDEGAQRRRSRDGAEANEAA